MKIRSGFVSNSSSSSFIVIDETADLESSIALIRYTYQGERLIVNQYSGNYEFGWAFEEYSDFGSKLIFAYLQYRYVKNTHPEWLQMIENVLQEINISGIEWAIDTEDCPEQYGYIDHQSASHEGENTEMFENETTLKRFLFCSGSYIQTGNDNE